MTVGELKRRIESMDDNLNVFFTVEAANDDGDLMQIQGSIAEAFLVETSGGNYLMLLNESFDDPTIG